MARKVFGLSDKAASFLGEYGASVLNKLTLKGGDGRGENHCPTVAPGKPPKGRD